MPPPVPDRFFVPLRRHILVRLFIVAGVASVLLLGVFAKAYWQQLEDERSRASLGVNLVLQTALENAMLKRDVPGLREIVDRLGGQPGVRRVFILNPKGEIRFASQADLLGQMRPALAVAEARSETAQMENGDAVLRSVNPVRNKPPCLPCHGEASVNPINGIVVVDYDARGLRRQALSHAAAFSLAGLSILLLSLGMLWYALNRRVIEPVAALSEASQAMADGDLARRVSLAAHGDELSRLGEGFNRMAERIETQFAQIGAQRAYLQHLLDHLPDGVRVVRVADRRVLLVNRAYCQQHGIAAEAALALPCHASSHQNPEPCVPTMVVCPLHALKRPGEHVKATHRHLRTDGTLFPVEIHAALIEVEVEGARETCIVESIRDISQAVRISHEQRLSELGLLAAGIAHEIHNPLASIKLGVQGLTREVEAGRSTPPQIVDYLGLIDSEIDKCVAVTHRLLLLSRTPAERQQIVDLGAALDDTVRLLAYDAETRRIRQRVELPSTPSAPLRVLADAGELRMIFLNLLQNAHHAMPDGGEVLARLERRGDRAVVEIVDSGVGIAQEVLPYIFDPFFSRRADEVQGTGLGLTIVKNIVERHRGEIEVDSRPGHGSLFRILFPLIDVLENAEHAP